MSNYEQITASLEALGTFLRDLPCADAPWHDDFWRKFCAACPLEDCDPGPCPHEAERDNPTWWLAQEAGGVVA